LKFQIGEQEELANKLNATAERRYHAAHNSASVDDTIDVHGLKPAEATRQVDLKLRKIQLSGGKHLRVIVGRGKHSKGGVPVLKPAVREHILRYLRLHLPVPLFFLLSDAASLQTKPTSYG